ncbi:MAG: hypothetical protein C0401_01115 [Anaerolinea sp.]|nr:hypothetical protein [Anaerolinea sp.]
MTVAGYAKVITYTVTITGRTHHKPKVVVPGAIDCFKRTLKVEIARLRGGQPPTFAGIYCKTGEVDRPALHRYSNSIIFVGASLQTKCISTIKRILEIWASKSQFWVTG